MVRFAKLAFVLFLLCASVFAYVAIHRSKPAITETTTSETETKVTAADEEDECEADAAWFSASAPRPPSIEPARGNDCEFYQRALQHFLYAVAGEADSPRFLGYQSYADLFGGDPQAGLLSGAADPNSNKKLMVLAPRLEKSAQVRDAGDILQAGSNSVLIDEAGHPIFYNIFVDPEFAKEIKGKGYNNLAKLLATAPETELPPDMVEFKAAWQIVDAANPPSDRIVVQAKVPWLTTAASTFDPSKKVLVVDKAKNDAQGLRTVTVAMIGLHVVFTTVNHPEMIWATFEYVRNAPSTKGNPIDPQSKCSLQGEPADGTVNDDGQPYLLWAKGDPASGINKKPASMTVVDDANQTFGPKSSIVRVYPFSACSTDPAKPVTAIDGAITALNNSFAKKNKSAWLTRYVLVGATWLDDPRSVFKSGATFTDAMLGGEDRLSSVAMESYTQTGSKNCFACHHTDTKGKLEPMRISVSHLFQRFANPKK